MLFRPLSLAVAVVAAFVSNSTQAAIVYDTGAATGFFAAFGAAFFAAFFAAFAFGWRAVFAAGAGSVVPGSGTAGEC